MEQTLSFSMTKTHGAGMLAWGLVAATVIIVACGGGAGSKDSGTLCVTSDKGISVELSLAFPDLVFEQPLALLQNPQTPGRWYVVEQTGRVLTVASAGADSADIFIDVSDRISTGGESGLLGMVFHPDFFSNGYFYLSYTEPGQPLISHITRYTSMDGGVTADPVSELVIMSIDQPYENHNGGHIAFGPVDGHLYIGLGDGGSDGDPDGNGQNSETLLGSLLRVDVDGASPYAIPADNPYASSPGCGNGSNCPEIYAWGFRNPWQFGFDLDTGNLWLGDVGQSSREEINLVENGGNYGWNILEGTQCLEDPNCDARGLVPPVVEYGRREGTSVTGGYVYRGVDIIDLFGDYIYGDFGSGRIWRLDGGSPNASCPQLLVETGLNIASFFQDDGGEIYVVSYGDGRIYRLSPVTP